jgi:hypothetical protein
MPPETYPFSNWTFGCSDDARDLHFKGISDHSPTKLSVSPKDRVDKTNLPTPKAYVEHWKFREFYAGLAKEQGLKFLRGYDRLAAHKGIIKAAALRTREWLQDNEPSGTYMKCQTFRRVLGQSGAMT